MAAQLEEIVEDADGLDLEKIRKDTGQRLLGGVPWRNEFTARHLELAASCPKVTFILQHAGMLEDLSAAGWETWSSGMRGLAAQPNIMCKLSALGTFIHRNDPDHIAKIVSECMAIFGPTRCLFGSNFPIEKLWTQYADVVAAYRRALEPFGEEAARSVLHDTATRVYRLE